MYQVNETLQALDPAEALKGESGVFEAVSPQGGQFKIVCRSGHSIVNIRPTEHPQQGQTQTWRLRKVAELRTEQDTV